MNKIIFLSIFLISSFNSYASTIISGTSHIPSPTNNIDFGVNLFNNFVDPVTNEFSNQGVNIQNAFYFTTSGSLFDINLKGGFLTRGQDVLPPLTLLFTTNVTDVSFTYHAVGTNNNRIFSALLDGFIVESFTFTSSNQNANGRQIFGFTGIIFDEIQIDSSNDWNFDNLAFTTASTVPIPAALWLFCSGLIGLIGFSKYKHT